jgi:hypothetical protein
MTRRKKGERFTFTVEGRGQFPVDMLRYDCCWPASEAHDSPAIALTLNDGDAYFKPRRVVLSTHYDNAPTIGRWKSFTWVVVGLGELRDAQ